VYWRVYYSNDKSVVDDIGTVEFMKFNDKTMVTFHSVHDLKFSKIMGVDIDKTNKLYDKIKHMVGDYFLECIKHYEKIAKGVVDATPYGDYLKR
jgi:hypothetical protein